MPFKQPVPGRAVAPGDPEGPFMQTKTKTEPETDEAREQARRALQTSMDTRQ